MRLAVEKGQICRNNISERALVYTRLVTNSFWCKLHNLYQSKEVLRNLKCQAVHPAAVALSGTLTYETWHPQREQGSEQD